jgi:uncharacterized membrane protein YfcA
VSERPSRRLATSAFATCLWRNSKKQSSLIALGGMLMAFELTNRVSESVLRRAFATLLLVVAATVTGAVLYKG